MTIEQQASLLELEYGKYARAIEQRWRGPADRQEALDTLKEKLSAAEATLRLPPAGQSATARSKLSLWAAMASAAVKEADEKLKKT